MTVSDGVGEPERHLGAAVSWDLFPLLGVSPMLGRGFTADDDRPNAAGVGHLEPHPLDRRYHADRNVLGRSILVNGKPHTVIGVMPPALRFRITSACGFRSSPRRVKDRAQCRGICSRSDG